MSCKSDCCARGIHGGRKGAVVDQHGGNGTEMEAENKCVGAGRTPKVEADGDFDEGTGEIGPSFASEKVVFSGS